jgi:hypothetical protein
MKNERNKFVSLNTSWTEWCDGDWLKKPVMKTLWSLYLERSMLRCLSINLRIRAGDAFNFELQADEAM